MKRYGFVYQFLHLSFGHKQCELRFLAALVLAHLLQCSRDTKALHPVFFRSGQRRFGLSPVFSPVVLPPSCDLRKILTDLASGGSRGGRKSSPTTKWPLAEYCSRVQMNVFSEV